ncbi:hypothetical protein [Kallotenue papyrolyticum]|uniref:hypothetical protein n=1 Tax=Kallotenue papyrolyticum TaxID=1325125 RepID=UPI001377E42D|nr:hypothetical protein [Kallotenue papyrolyticum]
MRILQFGSTSSAHVLAWKLINSPALEQLTLVPGNAATALFTTSVRLALDDRLALTERVLRDGSTLVLADEGAIASGLTDELRSLPLPVFGPDQQLWRLQASRCSAYEWLHHHRLPVPRGRVCTSQVGAEKFAASLQFPIIVAADDARGPVRVCSDRMDLPAAIADCLDPAGQGVLVQELVTGPLVSVALLLDGQTSLPLPTTRLHALDRQPFAPAIGAHSAATPLWTRLEAHLQRLIHEPLARAFRAAGTSARGWLGATCVLAAAGPLIHSVHLAPDGLEAANVLLRLGSDLAPLLEHCARSTLATAPAPTWLPLATLVVAVRSTAPEPAPLPELYEVLEPETLVFLHTDAEQPPRAEPAGARLVPDAWAIVASAAPTLEQARERVYRSLQRLARPGIVFAEHIGTHEL